uniref:DUF38 domain-containing protein n=1 Tax=Panagrolaimus sp. ES5 TaxID=591445 RepID=A0AC34FI50_9BILA
MDLSNSSEKTAPSSNATTSKNRKRKANDLKNVFVPSKRARFLSTYRRHQEWSLPESIIHYMAKNPKNAAVYLKLIRSCKYFFVQNPILVVERLISTWKNVWLVPINDVEKNIDFRKLSIKIWITESICDLKKTDISSIIPQIHRCDAKELYLAVQELSFKDFLSLSSHVEKCVLSHVVVKNEDSSIVPSEKLVEVLDKAKSIRIFDNPGSSSITCDTVKKLIEIPRFSKLDKFELINIPESFDIDAIFAFVKKNKHTKFELWFCDLSEVYKARVEAIIDEIIEAETHEYKVPYITFNGLHPEKRNKIIDLLED